MPISHWFKIADAYRFADSHGLAAEAERIRQTRIHSTFGKPHVVRKGYFVHLFESRGLLEVFISTYWPGRNSPRGDRTYSSYLDQRTLNERLMQGEPVADEERLDGFSEPEPEDVVDPASFALEGQLRDFILANLARLSVNGRRLTLFVDADGHEGREYPTAVGPIDILSKDDENNFVVFELKLERGPDRALGQLARYMGWVKLHLAAERSVHGVVVARSIDERLRYAACVMPNVSLLEYEIEFRLNDVGSMTVGTVPQSLTLDQN